jgi:hypothetical protein
MNGGRCGSSDELRLEHILRWSYCPGAEKTFRLVASMISNANQQSDIWNLTPTTSRHVSMFPTKSLVVHQLMVDPAPWQLIILPKSSKN